MGNEVMHDAIVEAFSDSHHRLCLWYIMRNVNSNLNVLKIVREFSYYAHGALMLEIRATLIHMVDRQMIYKAIGLRWCT